MNLDDSPKFAFLQQSPTSNQKIFLHSSMDDLHFDQRTSCYSFYTKVALSWYKNQEPEITPEHITQPWIFLNGTQKMVMAYHRIDLKSWQKYIARWSCFFIKPIYTR